MCTVCNFIIKFITIHKQFQSMMLQNSLILSFFISSQLYINIITFRKLQNLLYLELIVML